MSSPSDIQIEDRISSFQSNSQDDSIYLNSIRLDPNDLLFRFNLEIKKSEQRLNQSL